MPPTRKKVIQGWAMYDWANSSYALIITSAIFPAYYSVVAPVRVTFLGHDFPRDALASYTISFSFLLISVLSPILSSIADYRGNKKAFMQFFCYLGSLACGLLVFMDAGHIGWGLAWSVVASVGYCGSIVFYNAYLPEIATEEEQDRVSAKGYALGYVGSVLLMVGCLAVIIANDTLHWGWGAWPTRLSFLAVGLWWAGFAQITFRVLPRSEKRSGNALASGFTELRKVWNQLIRYPVLRRYLQAFFCYNMGVQTVMYMATYFAADELKMQTTQLITTILIIQLVAIAGAYLFARLSERTSNFFALGCLILIWIGICLFAYLTRTVTQFYILAFTVGMVMGGIQSMSRSTYSKLLPETRDTASFFAFYDVCDKVGTVLGTLTFGAVAEFMGGMRHSVLALTVYFILGFALLLLLPKVSKPTNEALYD